MALQQIKYVVYIPRQNVATSWLDLCL